VRRWWRWSILGGVLVALGVLGPTGWAYATSAGHRYDVEDVPDRPVAIVFGAGVRGSTPSPFLARRLDFAARLYGAGKVRAVLVSGDNSRPGYDETTVMRDYLIAHGLPARQVVADYAGFRTWDTCVRARRIFGVRAATVISQDFHLSRAIASCRAAGIDAVGVGDDARGLDRRTVGYGYVREVPADMRALADAVFGTDPRFLGPHEPGIRIALR